MQFSKIVLALMLGSGAAFVPAAPQAARSTVMNAGIADTIASMEGPEIFWGSAGVLEGHEESELKGHDGFSKLTAALKSEGVDLSGADYTILAPADSAFDKHAKEVGTPVTADILKYHVIPGKVALDDLTTDQTTLQGGTLTAYRKFRKNWLDYAIVGLQSEGPSKSSNWPADVQADNGVIHAIDTVLVPGAYEGER